MERQVAETLGIGGKRVALTRATTLTSPVWRTNVMAVVLAVALTTPPADATTIMSAPLRELTQTAGVAFAGTVDSMRVTKIANSVVTLVHFSHLQFAKGHRVGRTLTLRMYGGTYDGSRCWAVGQPTFELGSRYVVLSLADLGSVGNLFLPIVSMWEGFYPIEKDSKTGATVVHDWRGRPIVGLSGGHIVVLNPNARGDQDSQSSEPHRDAGEPALEVLSSDEDPGTRVSESAFLEKIRSFAQDR